MVLHEGRNIGNRCWICVHLINLFVYFYEKKKNFMVEFLYCSLYDQ